MCACVSVSVCHLVSPAEQARCVDVRVCIIFIIRNLDMIPHTVIDGRHDGHVRVYSVIKSRAIAAIIIIRVLIVILLCVCVSRTRRSFWNSPSLPLTVTSSPSAAKQRTSLSGDVLF